MQISTNLWKTVHLNSENVSFPKSHPSPKWQCHAVFHEVVILLQKEMQTDTLISTYLSLEAASAVIELR
jgi:hypothetical protein